MRAAVSSLKLGAAARFSARRVSTGQAGGIAVGLALLVALPDGIWGTTAQFAFTGTVFQAQLGLVIVERPVVAVAVAKDQTRSLEGDLGVICLQRSGEHVDGSLASGEQLTTQVAEPLPASLR